MAAIPAVGGLVASQLLHDPTLLTIFAFFGLIAGKLLVGILRPQELELVLDEQSLRWGPKNGSQETISRMSVVSIQFSVGTDSDPPSVYLRSGARELLPTVIIGPDQMPLAREVATLWPEVRVYAGFDELSKGRQE